MIKICTVMDHKGKLIDNLIRFFSGGDGSHTFILFDKKNLFEMHCPRGAIFDSAKKYFNNPRIITLASTPLFLTTKHEQLIYEYCRQLVKNKVKYDFRGIVGQAIKVADKINNPKRLYCSEAVAYVFQDVCRYWFKGLNPKVVTPSDVLDDIELRPDLWHNEWL